MAQEETHFRDRYGPVALVTGAAQGIGRAFSEALASRGLSLFMLDVQVEALACAAQEIAEAFGVRAWPLGVDLSQRDFMPGLLESIGRECALSEVGLVICNAAVGLEGPFLDESIDDLQRAVDVNCQSTLALAHAFAKPMVGRGRGGLMLISSGTALQGSPNYANYAATKAFNLVLAESLAYEWADSGVDVLAFVPGPTNTPGMRRSLPDLREGVAIGPIRLPGETAESALEALGRNATAARQPDHEERLAARRRDAEALIAKRRGSARRS